MDQVMRGHARDTERLTEIASALGAGIILVDATGQVAWMDETTRRQVNGGLQNLDLPIERSDGPEIDCFLSIVDVTINGRRSPLCVIQESRPESEQDFISALQTVMADTSWFTRTVIEKFKTFRQGAHPEGRALSDEIDILSDREREVLGLICEGRSDADMSKILQLSPNTVRNHIGALYRKIGVNRRSGAIIWARERGITCFELVAPKRRRRAIEHSNAQRE